MAEKPEIKFKQCNDSNFMYGRTKNGVKHKIQWIVIHFTAGKGDTAKNNADYFARCGGLNASAHFFVDENEIWQTVNLANTAWHCGSETGYYYNSCRNVNSIGIEMCSDWKNGEYVITMETQKRAVKLVQWLMEQYGIDINHVCMHYHVTHKYCPEPFVLHYEQWTNFLNMVKNKENDMTKAETTAIAQSEAKKIANQVAGKIAEQVYDKYNKVYNSIAEVPDWGKATIKKLVDKGYLKGNGKGLDLSEDLLRVLVINDRAGMYGSEE